MGNGMISKGGHKYTYVTSQVGMKMENNMAKYS